MASGRRSRPCVRVEASREAQRKRRTTVKESFTYTTAASAVV